MSKKENKTPFWVNGMKLSAIGVFVAVTLVPASHRINGFVTWALLYYFSIAAGLFFFSFAVSALVTRYRIKHARDAEKASADAANTSSSDELDAKAI